MSIQQDALDLPIESQYELAKTLASNCGYQLVAEDTERSLEIKELIEKVKTTKCSKFSSDKDLLIQGLEVLLK